MLSRIPLGGPTVGIVTDGRLMITSLKESFVLMGIRRAPPGHHLAPEATAGRTPHTPGPNSTAPDDYLSPVRQHRTTARRSKRHPVSSA